MNISSRFVHDVTLVMLAIPFHVVHEASGFVLNVLLGPEENPSDYWPSAAGGPIS